MQLGAGFWASLAPPPLHVGVPWSHSCAARPSGFLLTGRADGCPGFCQLCLELLGGWNCSEHICVHTNEGGFVCSAVGQNRGLSVYLPWLWPSWSLRELELQLLTWGLDNS